MKRWSYAGRWALVTGASSGLGAEFAEQLAARGMSLVLAARRVDRLEALAARLRCQHGVDAEVQAIDLLEDGAPRRLWSAATARHSIDLLINNAGFGAHGRFDVIDPDRHADLVKLNCLVLLELAHAALGDMRPRGEGAIINVASIAAYQPVPYLASYAASKAFVVSLSQALWSENRAAGIRVVALSPGRTPTGFQEIAGTGDPRGSFGVLPPNRVVRAGLRALERGGIEIVPGAPNALVTAMGRLVPRGLLLRLLGPAIRRAAGR